MRFVAVFLAFFLFLLAGKSKAQAWDFEVGRAIQSCGFLVTGNGCSNSQTVDSYYFLVRYNLPLSKEVLGFRAWLLPEGGVFLNSVPSSYLRLQFLIDGRLFTVFIDTRYWFSGEQYVRVGLRFGLP